LFQTFSENDRCKDKSKNWHIKFKEQPTQLTGYKYDAGNLVMGPTSAGAPNKVDIEKSSRELDRKI